MTQGENSKTPGHTQAMNQEWATKKTKHNNDSECLGKPLCNCTGLEIHLVELKADFHHKKTFYQ